MAKSRYTPDEIINMQVRARAGESIGSIADDYDTKTNTILYHVDPAYRRTVQEKAKARFAAIRAAAAAAAG